MGALRTGRRSVSTSAVVYSFGSPEHGARAGFDGQILHLPAGSPWDFVSLRPLGI